MAASGLAATAFGAKKLKSGKRNNHVATQKGPVSVGRPIGEKKAFMAACMNTVIITPSNVQII